MSGWFSLVDRQYQFDAQGSVAQTLSSSGAVLDARAYDAYGKELAVRTPMGVGSMATDPFGFDARWGYYGDRELGTYHCGAREYDPGTARWLERDPIGLAGGVNPYSYCAGNPVDSVDPEGTMVILGVLTRHPRRVPEDQGGLSSDSGPDWGLGRAGLGLAGTTLMAGAAACSMMATAYEGWSDARKAQAAFSRGLNKVIPRPSPTHQAHHLIPQSREMRDLIISEFGPGADSIIDNPLLNGDWWPSGADCDYHHQRYELDYARDLQVWIRRTHPKHAQDVANYARELTRWYIDNMP